MEKFCFHILSAIKKVYSHLFSQQTLFSYQAVDCYCTLVVVVVLAAVYSYNSKSVRFTSHFDRDSWQRSHSQWQQLISKQSTVIVRCACAVNKQHLAMISGGGGSLVWKENRSSETHFYYYVTCISKCQKTKSGINKFSEPEWLYLHNVTLPSVPPYFIDLYRFLCRVGWVLLIMIMNFSTFFFILF